MKKWHLQLDIYEIAHPSVCLTVCLSIYFKIGKVISSLDNFHVLLRLLRLKLLKISTINTLLEIIQINSSHKLSIIQLKSGFSPKNIKWDFGLLRRHKNVQYLPEVRRQ
jgi:hypothetical protein